MNVHTLHLGNMTCLVNDVIGDYSFSEPLTIGQRIIFDDIAHYSIFRFCYAQKISTHRFG